MKEGKNITIELNEIDPFGGSPLTQLVFNVVDIKHNDVTIIQTDGKLEHGFQCEPLVGIALTHEKVTPISEVIQRLEEITEQLKAIS